jgi:hypothetical protein
VISYKANGRPNGAETHDSRLLRVRASPFFCFALQAGTAWGFSRLARVANMKTPIQKQCQQDPARTPPLHELQIISIPFASRSKQKPFTLALRVKPSKDP